MKDIAPRNTRTSVSMTGFIDNSNLSRQSQQTATRLVVRRAGEEGDLSYALSLSVLGEPKAAEFYSHRYEEKAVTQQGIWGVITTPAALGLATKFSKISSLTGGVTTAGVLLHSNYLQLEDWTLGFPAQKEIHDLGNEPFQLLRSIPVTFQMGELSGVVACFTEANISMVGETWLDAFMSLKAEIFNTIEDYEAHEKKLGPEPKRQLSVLRSYIIRKP